METAVLDTCVLYPDTLRDVLLRLAEADLFDPLWSEPILDELRRNVAAAIGDDRAARLDANLRRFFADSLVTGLEPLIAMMTNHEKDRHVLAAAVHVEAGVLVTFNLKDFPTHVPVTGALVIHPDNFLLRMLDADPAAVVRVLEAKVKDHRREPRTLAGLLDALEARCGVPTFAEVVRRRVFGERTGFYVF